MKRRFLLSGIMFSFIIMLLYPQQVFKGASEGLLLWFQIILPTLLPFMIISNLLVHTNAITYIAKILGPFLGRFFCISKNGTVAVLMGFLCGYPMGAKVTSDLVKTNHISAKEGRYLLSFCNNTSPMFIMSYVIWQNLGRADLAFSSLIILFSAPIFCSFLFRIYYRQKAADFSAKEDCFSNSNVKLEFSILDTCIMNSFETIAKIGGYIILFSILLTLLKIIPFHHPLWNRLVLPSLEITNGIPMLCKNTADFPLRFIEIMTLTSFGGFCAIAQTKCMLADTGIPIAPYIIEKLITALVTSLFTFFYLSL